MREEISIGNTSTHPRPQLLQLVTVRPTAVQTTHLALLVVTIGILLSALAGSAGDCRAKTAPAMSPNGIGVSGVSCFVARSMIPLTSLQ